MSQLFSLDDNGTIVYNEQVVEDGSLFGSTEPTGAEASDTEAVALAMEADLELLDSTVTGGDVAVPVSSNVVTYNYTVYAVPSDASGYPNSNSISYLEDVVQSYPLNYDYVAYRTDADYAQSMILFIGPESSYDGSTISITDCDIVELTYSYDSSNRYYYLYRNYSHEDSADITLSADTLAYTNIVPGYAAFETTLQEHQFELIFAGALVAVVASYVIGRLLGGKNHA